MKDNQFKKVTLTDLIEQFNVLQRRHKQLLFGHRLTIIGIQEIPQIEAVVVRNSK